MLWLGIQNVEDKPFVIGLHIEQPINELNGSSMGYESIKIKRI